MSDAITTAGMDRPIIPLGQGMTPMWPDMFGGWPGEPDDELTRSPELLVVCDCGQHVPYADMYGIPHPYREIWGCLDCWMQSRAGAS